MLAACRLADYFDERRAGQVDMTRAVRSPGSTLKPFIYGLAFEDGFVHPESLIDDRPVRFGTYAPENFDMTFQGTVPVRKALQLSLNVPAIALLDRVGSSRLSSRLKQAGGNLVLPKDEAPGLAMGLGGVGITLAGSGAALCRAGAAGQRRAVARDHAGQCDDREPTAADGSRPRPGRSATCCSARRRRKTRVHNRIAFKTGTSYGYRDAWSVGFDGRIDHRRLGRPSRRRAGAGPGRPHGRGADPVRRLCAHRQAAGAAAEGAEGRAGRQQRQAAAAAAAVPSRRRTDPHRQRSGAATSSSR